MIEDDYLLNDEEHDGSLSRGTGSETSISQAPHGPQNALITGNQPL